MNKSLPNYQYGGALPAPFKYSPSCSTNQQAKLYPGSTGIIDATNKKVEWETVPMGPTTVKHLYGSTKKDGVIKADYPQMMITRPKNTLYGHNFLETYPTGLGRTKVRSDHYKVYPLTNRSVSESRDYTSYYFPQPQWAPDDGIILYENHVKVDGRK